MGGTHRPGGGKFVFLSGRPYRWNHAALRANSETILRSFFGEPFDPTAVVEDRAPQAFSLAQNHPNPFNPETTIRFTLPSAGPATIRVYDVAGRLVATVLSEDLTAGPHTTRWDGKNIHGDAVASGVYFYTLTARSQKATRKLVLLR